MLISRALALIAGVVVTTAPSSAREAANAAQPPPAEPSGPQRPSRPAARTRLLREGSFVTGRHARLAREGREWSFVFDPQAGAPVLPAMIVFPGQRLTEMQRLVESRADPISFIITGEVFTYKDRNYILPIVFSVDSGVKPDAQPRGATPAAPGGPDATRRAATGDDPAISDLISDVERGSGARRDIAPGEGRAGGAEPTTSARREGELIKSRRGRVRRDSSGDWLVTFDNDTAPGAAPTPSVAKGDPMPASPPTPAPVDPPMGLLPCQTRARLEALASRASEALPVTLSGQVFLYDGQNFLLPTLFVVDYSDASGLRSAQ